MKYTIIDNTDISVSQLSFGTASLHHLFSAKDRQKLLGAAADIGISHFDTSPYYGYGLAETALGQFMKGRRNDYTVTTKIGLYGPGRPAGNGLDIWTKKLFGKIYQPYSKPEVDWSINRARHSLENSLKRLNCDSVDFLFLHEPEPVMAKADEFLRWMEDEKSRGTIRYWGLAGLKSRLEPWLIAKHPLSKVLQTGDDLHKKTANYILERERKLQFTYGYLSSQQKGKANMDISTILNAALDRNNTGSILISTRRTERLKQIGNIIS